MTHGLRPAVVQLCDFSPEYGGSFVDSLIELARHTHTAMGLDTVCILPRAAAPRAWVASLRQAGLDCRFADPEELVSPDGGMALAGVDPWVLHAHFAAYDLPVARLKLSGMRHSAVVWHVHSLAGRSMRQRAKDVLKARLVARWAVDAVMAVGPAVVDNLRERGYPAARVALVENGVSTLRFARSRATAAPGATSTSHDRTTFFLLGWEPRRKGVDLFLAAASQLLTAQPASAADFVVIGREPTRAFVDALDRTAALDARLRIVEPVADLATLMPDVDVLVSASRSEAFGYAIAEALAAGKLVVCSDIPGGRQVFGQAPGAWFFDPARVETLTACLHEVEQLTASQRRSLADGNARMALARFGLETWAQRVIEVYRPLLARRRTARLPARELAP